MVACLRGDKSGFKTINQLSLDCSRQHDEVIRKILFMFELFWTSWGFFEAAALRISSE